MQDPHSLFQLSANHLKAYLENWDQSDLDAGIKLGEEAMQLHPTGNLHRASLHNLVAAYLLRFEIHGNPSDADSGIRYAKNLEGGSKVNRPLPAYTRSARLTLVRWSC